MTVDIIFNCYEKTLDRVLNRDFINNAVRQNHYSFQNRLVVINNVQNRLQVEERARKLQNDGDIDGFVFVEDKLEGALKMAGLQTKDLGRIPWFSSWAFVMIQFCRSEYFLHWDADARLSVEGDWITPSVQAMEENPAILVSNPMWTGNVELCRSESQFETDKAFIGFGFSDQIFLARKSDLARPVYKCFHIYSLRYPMAFIARIFECRLDSYMRCCKRLRWTSKAAVYDHPDAFEATYPSQITLQERVRRFLYNRLVRIYSFIKGRGRRL